MENRDSLIQPQGQSSHTLTQAAERHPLPHAGRRGIPEVSELVLACRHHLWLTTCLGALISTACALLAWCFTDAPYAAESLLRVRQHQDVVFSPQASRADDAAFVRSQEQLAVSPQVLAAALSSEQIKSVWPQIPQHDADDWLKNGLRVESQTGAEVLRISALHTSPRVAQVLCNAVTEAYLTEITSRLSLDRQRRQDELGRAAREADRRLDELWEELTQVALQVGSDSSESLTIRDEIQLQSYRDYARQLQAAQQRGNELQSLLTAEQTRLESEQSISDNAIEQLLTNHPDVLATQARIARIDEQIQQMREVVARDDSPRLTRLFEDRQSHQTELDTLLGDLTPRLRERLREQNRVTLENSLTQLRKQIELNQSEKEFLHSRMKEIDSTIVRTDDNNGVQLAIARHEVDRQTRLADGLWQSLEGLKIENQSQPRVTLMELAGLPSQANHGKQLKAAGASAVFAWMIVIFAIGGIEWKSCRVRGSEDLTANTARPVFGAHGLRERSRATSNANFTSGVREAAARLMLSNAGSQTVPTLMISGAAPGEPGHLVALELARAFRFFRHRTLLIDCDVSGILSQLLKAEHRPGMLQVDASRTNAGEYILPSSEDGLDFLPLGLSQGAVPWIDPVALRNLLLSLRAEYSAVVLNGPAALPSSESLLLAAQVDQTLFAVFPGTSRWNRLVACEQIAVASGIDVAGFILHPGAHSATLELRLEPRVAAAQADEAAEATEESLREDMNALQQEMQRVTSHTTEQTSQNISRELSS